VASFAVEHVSAAQLAIVVHDAHWRSAVAEHATDSYCPLGHIVVVHAVQVLLLRYVPVAHVSHV
jgi:hypothetical protein